MHNFRVIKNYLKMDEELNHDGTTDPLLDIQVKLQLFKNALESLKFYFEKSKKFIYSLKENSNCH